MSLTPMSSTLSTSFCPVSQPGSSYESVKQFLESDSESTDSPFDQDFWEEYLRNSNSIASETIQHTKSSSKTCPKCQTNKRQIGSTGRTKPYCQSCEKIYSQERYNARRIFVDNYKLEIGCEFCGFNEHAVALEFDHIDPKTKKYSIGSQLISMSWKALHEEIAKCRVLCANCHQIHTHESHHYSNRRWHKILAATL